MKKINEENNKQLIAAAKERLRWYTLEASEEEFDEEEVDALVNLLNALESGEAADVRNDQQELDNFYAYVEQREAEVSTSDFRKMRKGGKAINKFVKKHKIVAAAAVVLVVAIVAGGSLGAVNANQGNGFFHWLKQDEEGMTMITSPENLDSEINVASEVEYEKVEDVPEVYQQYLINVESIKQLENYKLKYIRVHKTDERCGIKRCFIDESGGKRIYIGVFIYSNEVSLSSMVHLSKEVEDSIENIQDEVFLIKENPEGDTECTIYFYKDNIRYYVEGNVDSNILMEIATAYKNIVFQ